MTETYADKAIILEPSTLKVLSGDGTLEIRTGAIDYYKKSTAVKVAFGMIGSLIEGRGKLMFSIQDSDVFRYDYIPYKKGQIPVITLKNGIAYAVSFAHPAQSCPLLDAHIRSLFSREETRQPEPEPRIQQRTMGSSPRTETINMAEETEKAEEYYKMASQYYAGTGGVRQDYEKALEYYTAAAKLKHSDAMYMLGTMFLEGNGTPVNDNLALVWLNLAAVKDNRYALKQLGYLHRIGRGVPQDYQKAMEYYRKAVDAGNIDCWNNIGYMYHFGLGVATNYTKAMNYYKRSADAGRADAMTNIGELYRTGSGVPQNYEIAYDWYAAAAEHGDRTAVDMIRKLVNEGHISRQRASRWV